MVVDVDHFKAINNTLGHTGDDRKLQATARVFREQRRLLDRLSRSGGDEFVLVLPETDLDGGHVVSNRLWFSLTARSFRTFD